jgi:hypothetical protein
MRIIYTPTRYRTSTPSPNPEDPEDGIPCFKPVIIFYGKGTMASRENYDPRVDVHFNETAYNNEELFSQ